MNIDVIEDNLDFMVVHKPEGLLTMGEKGQEGEGQESSLLSSLQTQFPRYNLHPVHRLDKGTSGLLLVAKTSEANRQLSLAFLHKRVKKHYIALSRGKPKKKQGRVTGDMQKARNGSWKLMRSQIRPAITAFDSINISPGLRLYFLKPDTGKTHQLRVALRALSVPILGDIRYGGAGADRLYLHAIRLAFEFEGKHYDFHCAPYTGECFLDAPVKNAMADYFALNT